MKGGSVKGWCREGECHDGTPPVGQKVGGTQPTGMYSCFVIVFIITLFETQLQHHYIV